MNENVSKYPQPKLKLKLRLRLSLAISKFARDIQKLPLRHFFAPPFTKSINRQKQNMAQIQ